MNRKVAILWIGIALVTAASRVHGAPVARDEILQFVKSYIDANNKADATAIMDMTSRKATVSSVEMGTITRGWEGIRSSVDAAIGSTTNDKLTLGVVDVQELGPNYALALAPFSATTSTTQGDLQVRGALTLVLERTAGKWKMLHEHVSLDLQAASKVGE
jgi:uncharacterized protein (TIGR02246 family)